MTLRGLVSAEHVYLSTSCFHDRHDRCQAGVGHDPYGATFVKAPGVCKFCNAPCTCPCHAAPVDSTEGETP